MNTLRLSFVAAATGLLLSIAPAAIAGPKEYQMTGPIVSLTDTSLVVQKGKSKENWEFARSADTQGLANMKVGDRITVKYSMTAVSAVPKPEKEKSAEAAASASPAKPAADAPAASPAK